MSNNTKLTAYRRFVAIHQEAEAFFKAIFLVLHPSGCRIDLLSDADFQKLDIYSSNLRARVIVIGKMRGTI